MYALNGQSAPLQFHGVWHCSNKLHVSREGKAEQVGT